VKLSAEGRLARVSQAAFALAWALLIAHTQLAIVAWDLTAFALVIWTAPVVLLGWLFVFVPTIFLLDPRGTRWIIPWWALVCGVETFSTAYLLEDSREIEWDNPLVHFVITLGLSGGAIYGLFRYKTSRGPDEGDSKDAIRGP